MCNPGNESTSTSNSTEVCGVVSDIVYLEGFLTAASNLPGNLLTIFLMDRIGRKILLCECQALQCAFCAVCIGSV